MTAISPAVVFFKNILCFSQPDCKLNLTKLYTTTGQEWENKKYKLFDRLPKYSWIYENVIEEYLLKLFRLCVV